MSKMGCSFCWQGKPMTLQAKHWLCKRKYKISIWAHPIHLKQIDLFTTKYLQTHTLNTQRREGNLNWLKNHTRLIAESYSTKARRASIYNTTGKTSKGPFYYNGLIWIPTWISLITSIIKSAKKLLIHSQTSTVLLLKFVNGKLISSYTLLDTWLLIQAGIKVNPC